MKKYFDVNSPSSVPLSLYIHIPWCIKKCPYCDFNSHKLTEYNDDDWLNAYLFQLDIVDDFFLKNSLQKNKLSSIFFGGGTPSLMKPFFVEKIINKASKIFGLKNNIEITLEANPSSVEFTNVSAFKKAGINSGRFIINTTIGILGFIDVAQNLGFPDYEKEDYGQSLAKLGVGPGCYVVLPVLGPSTVRDAAGSLANVMGGDAWYNVTVKNDTHYFSDIAVSYTHLTLPTKA